MDSKTYWAKREEEALKHYITDEKEYDRQIKQIYQNMLDSCNEQINAFYGRYASKEGITLAEAKKRVNSLDIAKYERKAKRYVKEKDFSDKANEEMRLYNATMKINRLEMLKANIGLELIAGHDELDKFMSDILKGRTADELARQAGILGKTIRNNAKLAHTIPNASFHSGTFSDRIWQYQDLMRDELSKQLQTGLIQGKNPRAIAKSLQKYWYGNDPRTGGGAVYCMERLMRTELARVQTEAQKQSFERNGFKEYTFLANSNCCDICKGKDGKHFKVKDMMPGENAAPMHPHCRCSTAAYEDSEEYNAWLDYLDKGGTTEEWEKYKAENSLYLRNNLPKAFIDTRTVGSSISEQELTEVVDFAKSKGVQIGLQGNVTGGFETYCGDVNVLKEIIEELSQQQNSSLYKRSGAKNAILCYDNVLGYNGDLSKIDIGAFAITKGRTITLN
jgi:SPP1 gp7 family putative phage head morphogenesis protein